MAGVVEMAGFALCFLTYPSLRASHQEVTLKKWRSQTCLLYRGYSRKQLKTALINGSEPLFHTAGKPVYRPGVEITWNGNPFQETPREGLGRLSRFADSK